MTVQRYRSVADMPRPEVVAPGELEARIRATWNRAQRLCPTTPPRGVTRFASIEAANEARRQATLVRMRTTAGM